MNLVQFLAETGDRRVGAVENNGDTVRAIKGWNSTYDLVLAAIRKGAGLAELVDGAARAETYDFDELLANQRVLLPLDHPDPAHCLVSGTGLTHLGSAKTRDAMHAKIAGDAEALTDSMRIFRWGVEGGKPEDPAQPPVQPEWFYKGDGSWLRPTGAPLERPAFADDGGEEAEMAGLYVIGDNGNVYRAGFALGNEFSDHVMEKKNYLYLAHSKLRTASLGPELHLGDLPASIEGRARLLRDGEAFWSGVFYTGEENMSYGIAGLEYHHFKYARFRRPGDVHCHFFGTSLLSFSNGVRPEDGDVFEIFAPPFNRPLRNPVQHVPPDPPRIQVL